MVTGLETREAILWARRDQIVTDGLLVLQKFVSQVNANCVLADIFGSGVAFAVAIEPC
jgi:hypothetical protein